MVRSPTTMLPLHTSWERFIKSFFFGCWKTNSLSGFRCLICIHVEGIYWSRCFRFFKHHTSVTAVVVLPPVLVNSSPLILQTCLFPCSLMLKGKSDYFSWRRFCRQRRQKYSITSKNTLLCSVVGFSTSNTPLSYNVWRSSSHIVGVCSTLEEPSRLRSAHFASKPLLA